MKRTTKSFNVQCAETFKMQMFLWSKGFDEIQFLDSNTGYNHKDIYTNFDCLLAVEAFTAIKTDAFQGFEKLNDYQKITNDWLFGFLSFDLKEDSHHLACQKDNPLESSALYFFQPKKLIILNNKKVSFHYLPLCDDEILRDFEEISNINLNENLATFSNVQFKSKTSRESYIENANELLKNIQLGNIYEVNYCIEFFDDEAEINPFDSFLKLNELTKSPFASFVKFRDLYVLCASPERYLSRKENKVISQPIKGTAKRFEDENLDKTSKENLNSNAKEISENVMIVDLVRNDLSITAKKRSVEVEELCEVYSFKQVHQMISTIVSQVNDEVSNAQLLKTTFPMGSMTGAPKLSALQLIDKFEDFNRGIYSGAIGYFDSNGNFDFNVVIRTLLYNSHQKYLSYRAGSALTAQANPEHEYEECLLKAKVIYQIFK